MVDALERRACVFAMMVLVAKTVVGVETVNSDLNARQIAQRRWTAITRDSARTRATVFAIMTVQGRPVMSVRLGDLEKIVRLSAIVQPARHMGIVLQTAPVNAILGSWVITVSSVRRASMGKIAVFCG
jgi:hypothetical protein